MDFKNCIFVIFLLSQCVLIARAATRVDAHTRARETMRRRQAERGSLHRRDAPLDTRELFDLTEGESLVDVRESADAIGTKVERLEETYKGYKVYDATVTVRKTKDGQLTGDASGTLIQNIDADLPSTEAKLTNEETLHIALKKEGDSIKEVTGVQYDREVFLDKDNRARLVNIVNYNIPGSKRPYYIIDVQSGEVLKNWEGFTTIPCCTRSYSNAFGGNEGRMGRLDYGDMPHCLAPTVVGDKCYLENKYVRVIDMHQSWDDSFNETAHFICNEGYDDAVNGAFSPALDAFFFGTANGMMYEEWFDTTPLKQKVTIRVHYGSFYENAYWDGEKTTFGDGGSYFYPLTSVDVVGHEVAHGVTEQASGLEYYYESGGLNEAFSDMMGESLEDYILNSDMMTGRTIMKTMPYLREFERPENDNMSISHVSDMTEWIDVHYSSGIYRRVWWVLIVDEGMNIREAATIMLHANRMYWHRESSFYDASCGVLKAALDLGYDTAPFRVAFDDIGLPECDVATHIFTLGANKTWTGVLVSDTINPIFRFEAPYYADTFMMDVTSHYGNEITITVMQGGWELGDRCKPVDIVGEGVKSVTVAGAAGQEYFIKLTPSDVPVECYDPDVPPQTGAYIADMTAGFTCMSGYESYCQE